MNPFVLERIMKFVILALLLVAGCLYFYQPDTSHNIPKVRIQTDKPIATTDRRFLSVALDTAQIVGSYFWDREGEMVGGRGKNKVPQLDLTDPELIRKARQLAPAYLRIGGSEADAVYYNIDGNKRPEGYDSEFTTDKLVELNNFAKETGLKIFFTLNQGPSSWKNNHWVTDNHERLFEFIHQKGFDWTFELGNEVFAYWAVFGREFQPTEQQYADNFLKTKSLLAKYRLNTNLSGPASAYWPIIGEPLGFFFGSINELLPVLKTNLGTITWHYYPTQSFRCPVAVRRASKDSLVTAKYLDEVSHWGKEMKSLRDRFAPNSDLWLGETGSAQCGGEPGVSDTYTNAIWWIDQLGQLARLDHKVVIRQNLIGADYAMLNDDISARPDYFASLLWKKHMGQQVLNVQITNRNDSIRIYSHCSAEKSKVALLAINISSEDRKLDLDQFKSPTYIETLMPSAGPLSSSSVLNGQPLTSIGQIRQSSPHQVTNARIDLPPYSLSFIQIPDVNHVCPTPIELNP